MVLLRICLSLAILAGIGVIVLSQVVLKPQIEGIITTRNDNKKGWDKAEVDKKKLNKDLKETQTELASTKSDLETTKTQLADTTKRADDEEKKAKDRAVMIDKLNKQVKAMDDELASWKATGYTPDQIAGLAKQVKDFKVANEAFIEENGLFKKQIDKLERELASIKGPDEIIPLPLTVKGNVLVVDPKWDFIILNVGAKHGLIDKGVLLISRNGALVAKVRVTSVQQDRSIANIMPGWKLKDVMEGDQVFPYRPTNL
jgi:F0F1-type ATP synthase membrane subunit b/b'